MLRIMNRFIERWMPLLTPISLTIGIIYADFFKPHSYLVPWMFAFITFSSSLSITLRKIGEALRHPLPIFTAIIIIQGIIPVIAFAAGKWLFPSEQWIVIGLVLAFSIPTAVASILWITIYHGNVSLALSTVILNTLLASLFVPATLVVFFRQSVALDTAQVMNGLFWMIAFPSVLGIAANRMTSGKMTRCQVVFSPLAKLALLFVIIINGSVVAPFILNMNKQVFGVTTVVFFIACTGYLLGHFSGKLLRLNAADRVSLLYLSGMRNIGVGSAIAVVYFPPAVALPVVIGTLFQQLLASFFGRILMGMPAAGKQEKIIKTEEEDD
ncbi:Predicted Na+-dependent transporter [Evansella caseinilytica]|uniref:Predicted Na+-dependent transporter n=1 Tax=Evansella caseinilytica TaxID=1503961 RepID=A0A1H3TC77_9BACI|nr:bile acid:sodium symporter family protein [Evansella caseinilytica]SDZ47710.1 Predicted Na+-dependent transporter [Evansella caseinilytica]